MGEVHNEHRLSLEEVHERELKMMKLFIKLCEQYNLRYYMAGEIGRASCRERV